MVSSLLPVLVGLPVPLLVEKNDLVLSDLLFLPCLEAPYPRLGRSGDALSRQVRFSEAVISEVLTL